MEMNTVENGIETVAKKSPLFNYFNEDGTLLSFQKLDKRIRRTLSDQDKLSVQSSLDLFFLHSQWTSYKKGKSFSAYLRDDLQLSRTHAYGTINSMRLLIEYFQYKGNTVPDDMQSFYGEIAKSVESVGIKKLIIMSSIKDEKSKFNLMDKMLSGETEISADELLIKVKEADAKKRKTKEAVLKNSRVSMVDNKLLIDWNISITFAAEVENELRQFIEKELNKYLDKH
jgi:hypothetical protein